MVTIRLDNADIKAGLASMRAKFPQAVRRALKRAGTSGRAEMARVIAADTGLPSTRVKREITVRSDDVSMALTTAGFRIPLLDFQARGPEPSRGRGRGVSYRAKSGRVQLPHAFIATMASGHRGVFQRSELSLPHSSIRELKGPSIAHVFEVLAPQGIAAASESFMKNVKSEIKFAMTR